MIMLCLEGLKDLTIYSETENNPNFFWPEDKPYQCPFIFLLIQLNPSHEILGIIINCSYLSFHLNVEGGEQDILKIIAHSYSDIAHNTRSQVYPYVYDIVKAFTIDSFTHVYDSCV